MDLPTMFGKELTQLNGHCEDVEMKWGNGSYVGPVNEAKKPHGHGVWIHPGGGKYVECYILLLVCNLN